MSIQCSICLTESCRSELTPLFIKTEKGWQKTGLSGMLELTVGRKITKGNESMLFVCNNCLCTITSKYRGYKHQPHDYLTGLSSKKICSDNWMAKKMKTQDIINGNESRILQFEEPDTRNHINSIPYECLAKIFMYLNNYTSRLDLEKVCLQWKHVSELAWNDCKHFNFYTYCGQFINEMLLRIGKHLKSFQINDSFSPLIPPLFNKYCRNIGEISILLDTELAGIDDVERYKAFTCLSNLEKVSISVLSGKVNWFEFLQCFPEKIKALVIINKFIEDKKQLTEFSCALERFHDIDSITFRDIFIDSIVMTEILRTKSLVNLEFEACDWGPTLNLGSNIENIQCLKISRTTDIKTSSVFCNFVNGCKNIKHLTLDRTNIPGNILRDIKKFRNLEYLELEFVIAIDDELISTTLMTCKNLRKLSLTWMSNLTEIGLQNISNIKNLEYLELKYLENINDKTVLSIVTKCKNLTHLDLRSYNRFGDSTLGEIANLVNLEFLNIKILQTINRSIIFSIKNSCKKLKSFHY